MSKQKTTNQLYEKNYLVILVALFFMTFVIAMEILFLGDKPTDEELTQKLDEIEQKISQPVSDSESIEESIKYLNKYKSEITDKKRVEVIDAKLSLLQIALLNEKQQYKDTCEFLDKYLAKTNNSDIPEINLIGHAKISIDLAVNLFISAYKCETAKLEKTLALTGFSKFENNDKLILTYYDNVISENNAKWISEKFGQKVEEIILNNDQNRDAIRILVINKSDMKPSQYMQFRGEGQVNFFKYQFDTFKFEDNKLFWKHDGKKVLDFSN